MCVWIPFSFRNAIGVGVDALGSGGTASVAGKATGLEIKLGKQSFTEKTGTGMFLYSQETIGQSWTSHCHVSVKNARHIQGHK